MRPLPPLLSPTSAPTPLLPPGASPLPRATPTPALPKIDTCDLPAPRGTWLQNHPTDVSAAGMVDHLLDLRAKSHAGVPLTNEDMIPYSETTAGNHSELFIDRDYFTEGFLPAIAAAKKSIHIAMLSFDDGRLGHYMVDTLIAKKQENPTLEIRVIADNFNSNAIFPWSGGRRNLHRLKEAGIEVVINNYFSGSVDHRKNIIVDSKVGFIGGSSFKDDYFGNEAYWEAFDNTVETQGLKAARDGAFLPRAERQNSFEVSPERERPPYGDFGISLKGPVVQNLQASFLQSWLRHGQPLNPEISDTELRKKYFPPLPCEGDLPIKLSHGNPGGPGEMRQNLLSIINGAENTLDIEMAYFHIDEFTEALVQAAQRGVKIRLISNSQTGIDKEFAWHANRQYYPRLLAAGVQLHELDHYSHRKFIVADDRVVFTTTGNPEFHSWYIGWDEIALIDSPAYAAEVNAAVILPGLDPENSKPVTLLTLEQESRWTRFKLAVITCLYSLFITLYHFVARPTLSAETPRELVIPAVKRSALRPDSPSAFQGNQLRSASPLVLAKPAA